MLGHLPAGKTTYSTYVAPFVQTGQMTPNLEMRGIGGGGVSGSYGENLEGKLNSEKRLAGPEIDTSSRFLTSGAQSLAEEQMLNL